MITRRIARLSTYVAARAVDAGLLRGSTDHRRFVVLGWYRTGSNLLLSLLNSDPAVVAYSEVFSPRGLFWGNRAYAPRDPDGSLERLRTDDAPAFLRDVVFRPHPRRVRAVGFKVFYPQLVVRPIAGLADALAALPGLHVIHLRRRNLLRMLVSDRLAQRTGQWGATSAVDARAAQERVGRLRLSADECDAYFTTLEERAAACERMFAAESVLGITYEDLVADRGREIGRARTFLGLPPAPSRTPLVKQTTRPLDELIEDYDELRAGLAGTRWESFCC